MPKKEEKDIQIDTGFTKKNLPHYETHHSAFNEIYHYRVGLRGLGGPSGYFIRANYPVFLPISVINLYYAER